MPIMKRTFQVTKKITPQRAEWREWMWFRPLVAVLSFSLAWLICVPEVRAACQEGCDSNSNVFLGEDALISNTLGVANVAIGSKALTSNAASSLNTAMGAGALQNLVRGGFNIACGTEAGSKLKAGD